MGGCASKKAVVAVKRYERDCTNCRVWYHDKRKEKSAAKQIRTTIPNRVFPLPAVAQSHHLCNSHHNPSPHSIKSVCCVACIGPIDPVELPVVQMHTVDIIQHLVRRSSIILFRFVIRNRLRRILDGIVVTAEETEESAPPYLETRS